MSCLFCTLPFADKFELPEDEMLDESEHFYTKAALGHFVFGYMLVISKDHYISCADLPISLFSELDKFSRDIESHIRSITDVGVMTFEHGAVSRPYRAGSCIDHAHLHLFPVGDRLVLELLSRFAFAELSCHSDIRSFRANDTPYIYFRTSRGNEYAAPCPSDLPSQFIRRVACNCLGCSELWDWRDSPLRDSLEEYKRRYKDQKQHCS